MIEFEKITVPKTGVNDEFLILTSLAIENETFVKLGDDIGTMESSKEIINIEAQLDGFFYSFYQVGDNINVGEILGIISQNKIVDLDKIKEELSFSNDLPSDFLEYQLTKKAESIFINSELKYDDLPKGKILREKDILDLIENKKGTIKSNKFKNEIIKSNVEKVIIIGGGKGADVLIDILLDDYSKRIVGIVDDNVKVMKNYEFPILDTSIQDFPHKISRDYYDSVIISIGSNFESMKKRHNIFEYYSSEGIKFTNVISKTAIIKKNVSIGVGNIIGDDVYIGTQTTIGDNNSISYKAIIGHHNRIGDSNLIAPNFCSSGSVFIGSNSILPAGVTTLNRITIGNNVIIPIGYLVDKDIEDDFKIKIKNNNIFNQNE